MSLKQPNRGVKKSARVIVRVKREVEIGEVLPSRVIMRRLYEGDCPQMWIPRSASSLGMMLTISKDFDVVKSSRGRFEWRRIE